MLSKIYPLGLKDNLLGQEREEDKLGPQVRTYLPNVADSLEGLFCSFFSK